MEIFVIAIVMWWSNPADKPYNNALEIDTLNGKPFFFVKQEDCFVYVDEYLEGLKDFAKNHFPTATAVEKIYCVPKEQKEV